MCVLFRGTSESPGCEGEEMDLLAEGSCAGGLLHGTPGGLRGSGVCEVDIL